MKNQTRPGRKKIVPDRLFNKLWTDAEKAESKEGFIRKYTSTMSSSCIDFKRRYGLEYDESVFLLSEIYDKQHMTFSEILEKAKKRKADVANAFCIPIRTVEDWYVGTNKCSSYIRLMLLRQYHLLNLGKYIYAECEEEYKENEPAIYKKSTVKKEKQAQKTIGSQEGQDDKLADIDRRLKEIENRNSAKPNFVENKEVQSWLEKTSYLDKYIKRN